MPVLRMASNYSMAGHTAKLLRQVRRLFQRTLLGTPDVLDTSKALDTPKLPDRIERT